MKKILLLTLLVTLTSCTTSRVSDSSLSSNQTSSSSNSASSGTITPIKNTDGIVREGDTVSVDYVGTGPDGKVFDSSLKEFAEKNPSYIPNPSRKFEPLVFSAKEGQMIEGFWKGVIGMKLGEKKKLVIPAEQAYGEEWISQNESVVDKKIFNSSFERTIPKSEVQDTIRTLVPKEAFGEKGVPKIGENISIPNGMTAKIDSYTATGVVLLVDNKDNPFSGKKIIVGTQITYEDGNVAKIIKVMSDSFVVRVENKSNPFAGKTLAVGLEGTYSKDTKIRVVSLEGDNVTLAISRKNPNPLAGKTLTFDVEIKDIK